MTKFFKNRKIMSFVLALVMIIGLMPSMAVRADGEEGTIAVIVKVTENGGDALTSIADGTTVVVKNEGGEPVHSFTMGTSDPMEFTGTTGKYTIEVNPAEADGYTASVNITGDTVDAFEKDPVIGNYAELRIDIDYTPSGSNDQYADEGTLELRLDAYHADTFEPFAADKLVGMMVVFTNQETGETITSTYNGGTWTIENMPAGSYNLTVTPAVIEGYEGKSECDGECEVSQFKKNDGGASIQKMTIAVSYTEIEEEPAKSDIGTVCIKVDGYVVDKDGNQTTIDADKIIGTTVKLTNTNGGDPMTATFDGKLIRIPDVKAGEYWVNVEPAELDGYKASVNVTNPFDASAFISRGSEEYLGEEGFYLPLLVEVVYRVDETADDSKTEEPTEEPKEDESKVEEPAEDSKTEEPTEEPKEDESKAEEEQKPAEPKKTVDELAQEVLDGKWGANEERKQRLTEAGYDYYAVQERVNQLVAERDAKAEESKKDDYTETSGNEGQTKPPTEESSRTTNRSEDQPNTGDFGMVWFMVVGIAVAAIAVLARSRKAARN